jgi:hypothetical protein
MSTITLDIARGFTLPVEFASRAAAVLAMRGAGKSNVGVVLAEQMTKVGVPWVAVDPKGDWWGIRSSRDGKRAGLNVPVLGGDHGDLPLDPDSGKVVAELIVEHDLTCVLDVSAFSKRETVRFLTAFFERLLRLNKTVRHVFLEEADEYVPQRVAGDITFLVGATEKLVKRGRFKGLGITMLTQRSASLNKDVLTQIDSLFVLRTPSPQDRDAINAWVKVHDAPPELMTSLPSLEDGEGWVISPQFLKTVQQVKFHRRSTYDSGATPVFGAAAHDTARVASVDLDALRTKMAASIQKAKEEDPKALKAEVAALKRTLTEVENEHDRWLLSVANALSRHVGTEVLIPNIVPTIQSLAQPEPEVVQYVPPDVMAMIEKGEGIGYDALEAIRSLFADMRQTLVDIAHENHAPPSRAPVRSNERVGGYPAGPKTAAELRPPPPSVSKPRPAPTATGGVADPDLSKSKAKRAILTALIQHGSLPIKTLAVFTGYKHGTGGFNNALGSLRTKGYINKRGEPIEVTPEGIAAMGGTVEELPTGQALIDHWKSKGKILKAHREILDVLTAVYPATLADWEVAERTPTKYVPGTGGFNNALGALRTIGLIQGSGRELRATDAVMGVT